MVTTASSSCESFSVKKSILSWDSHYKSALCKWRGDVTIGVQAGWSYTATLPLQLAFEAHIREMALEIARFTPPHQVNTWHRHDQQLETLSYSKLSSLLLPRSWGKQISIPRPREAFPPVPVYQHLLRANESPFCLQKGSFCIPFVYNRKVVLNHLILENILSIYSTISICISIYFAPYAI